MLTTTLLKLVSNLTASSSICSSRLLFMYSVRYPHSTFSRVFLKMCIRDRTYTITLRSGIAFSNGAPLTAADVVASLQAARASSYYGSRLSDMTGVSAPDESTVVITLSTAYCSLPLLLDVPIVQSGTAGNDIPIGTGEYVLVSGSGVLQPNKFWWRSDSRFGGQTITLTAAADAQTVREVFERGTVTLACACLLYTSPVSIM